MTHGPWPVVRGPWPMVYQVCEKETKTKAFSKEGLSQQPKEDPAQVCMACVRACVRACAFVRLAAALEGPSAQVWVRRALPCMCARAHACVRRARALNRVRACIARAFARTPAFVSTFACARVCVCGAAASIELFYADCEA